MSEPEKREKLAENDPEQGLAAAFRQLFIPKSSMISKSGLK